MGSRTPKPIPFDEVVWPISDDPLDMGRRLDFADWLASHGHKERAMWIRRCSGDCQYARDLRASFSPVEFSTYLCTSGDPIWRPTQSLEDVRPDWLRHPPPQNGSERCHFGRIIISELGDPSWLYDGDWLVNAWKQGWLEILYLLPNDGECLMRIAEMRAEFQSVPILLDASRTFCEHAPETQYNEILRFPGLHGLVFCQNDLSLRAIREFADKAQQLRYLHLLGLQKRKTSIAALEQLGELPHLRSTVIGGSLPDDDTIQFVVAAKQLKFLGLFGKHLTDDGLEALRQMPSLRYLAIDVPKVSRDAIERLRRERPQLTIHVQGDMRDRLGPV